MWRGRSHLSDSRGFTLIELMVVLLILGILALIALPSFIGQRAKGHDTEAQSTIRSAQMALRTYETDHDTFAATRADLEKIEPSISSASADFAISGTGTTFTLTERSASGTDFTLERDASGVITRTCSIPARGLCRAAADADGNRW
jgi:type IV pilus assembly protein PilA